MDAGIGRFLHDQVKITMPPRAKITVDLSPPNPGVIWVTFALTFGNIKEDSFEIWHWSGDGRMKRHLDPTWYSLGIGASFVYPLWIYCSIWEPHTIEIENITEAKKEEIELPEKLLQVEEPVVKEEEDDEEEIEITIGRKIEPVEEIEEEVVSPEVIEEEIEDKEAIKQVKEVVNIPKIAKDTEFPQEFTIFKKPELPKAEEWLEMN